MNTPKLLIGGLLILGAVFVALTLRPARPAVPRAGAAAVTAPARPAPERPGSKLLARPKKAAPQPAPAAASDAAREGAAEQPLSREQAVAAWDALVDEACAPGAGMADRIKEAFDRLDKADQMDGIRRALNLFPDERFPDLVPILMDKDEAEDVLDAIFSDALNRSEEIKLPLMRALRKDRSHPMFFESARILDVIEPAAGPGSAAPAQTP